MCDILASKLTLKIIELVLNTFYNEMLQIMKELHGKFEGKKWWPRIKSSLGESTWLIEIEFSVESKWRADWSVH